jgi:hypothetical protein
MNATEIVTQFLWQSDTDPVHDAWTIIEDRPELSDIDLGGELYHTLHREISGTLEPLLRDVLNAANWLEIARKMREAVS